MSPVHLRLRELREAKGLTQMDLVEATGLRQATISAIERGRTARVDFAVLERLADVLGIEPGELVVRTP